MQRYGSVVRLKPDQLEAYKAAHAAVWPGVAEMIRRCHIRNYSIYYRDGYLFSYFEYTGDDLEADMAAMAADPETQRWWAFIKPMQEPVATAGPEEWWAPMEEVFHQE